MTVGCVEAGLLCATDAQRAVQAVFCETGTIRAYLDVERALARALARADLVPPAASDAIAAACTIDRIDPAALRRDAARVGYPIVPLVEQLVAAAGDAGRWVHLGATTQDVMDTALVLQIRSALPCVQAPLDRICELLRNVADRHRHTLMAGRSKLQHALPITLGYKAAVWLDQVDRRRSALQLAGARSGVVQFGGAVGTLAALGDAGTAVRAFLGDELGLAVPEMTWHVSRDRLADLVHALATVNAGLGKIALDVAHLMSTEVDELREPFAVGRGTSSTMPQKRNPVLSEAILEAAHASREAPSQMLSAMLQDHERATGSSYVERRAVANALMLAAGAGELTAQLLEGLEVNSGRMRSNLGLTNGQMMAESAMMLAARTVGRLEGHRVLHRACLQACASGRPLRDVLLELCELDGAELDVALDPARYLGTSDAMIDAVLARTETKRPWCTTLLVS
jgi:3-carboxy-cis,cis-muconate cycloisomerase